MADIARRTLHVLTGCTAVGKTEWALRWAEVNGAEIVSCDSLLFYRGMDIGTAKPSTRERARVPHHLIDICDVTEAMDITQFIARARTAVEAIMARGRRVLITGGSGFYLKAFFSPVADGVIVPPELRTEIAARLQREGLAALVTELARLNANRLGTLDCDNPRRVTRALERCLASGKQLRELAAALSAQPSAFADFDLEMTQLERPPEELNQRIATRVSIMIADGLVEEVRRLRAAGFERNPSAARAIGYREVLAMDDGQLSLAKLEEEIVKNTRGLVRKQRTWFRTQLPPHHVVAAENLSAVDMLFGEV